MSDVQAPAPGAIQYEDRTLVFFDILGWQELVKASATDATLVGELEAGLAVTDKLTSMAKGSIVQISQFSDHVCVSMRGFTPRNLVVVCAFTSIFVKQLMRQGFCVRGAIVGGQLIHRDNRIYGPALLEAVYIESRVAKYPRLVLSEAVTHLVPATQSLDLGRVAVLTDRDGLSYLDVVEKSDVVGIRDALLGRQPTAPDLDVKAKHAWLLAYLDSKEAEAMPPLTDRP